MPKTPQISRIDNPRGTRDYGTKDAITLNQIISVVEEVFKRFGFSPIITPVIETTDVLQAKVYGEEQDKEIYIIEGGDSALRFDFTVPLARYMAMNKDLQLPFKRYQIDRIWRKDEPQHMRSREFFQADVDIVGSTDPSSDAECIAATLTALESLGITDYVLLINSRPLLTAILTYFGVAPENQNKAIRILDKLSKLSMTEVLKQLHDIGMDDKFSNELISYITEQMSNEEKLKKLETTTPSAKEEIAKLLSILDILRNYRLKGAIKVDFSLARGLAYYTGAVWEVIAKSEEAKLPSIAGGGRYDSLIGTYSRTPTPAVGSSLGITRIFEILKNMAETKTCADIYLAQIGKDNTEYAIGVASRMRSAGVHVDLSVMERGISKQLDYSNSVGIRYVGIIGAKEKSAGKVKLRDMVSGTEELLSVDEIISKLKK